MRCRLQVFLCWPLLDELTYYDYRSHDGLYASGAVQAYNAGGWVRHESPYKLNGSQIIYPQSEYDKHTKARGWTCHTTVLLGENTAFYPREDGRGCLHLLRIEGCWPQFERCSKTANFPYETCQHFFWEQRPEDRLLDALEHAENWTPSPFYYQPNWP